MASDEPKQQQKKHCIDFDDVQAAATRIAGVAHKTPVLTSNSINQQTNGRSLYFKVEAMQRTGSFKFRGALNATRFALENDDDSNNSEGTFSVVTHSSGNHAQALALAAKLSSTTNGGGRNVSATIVMPENAPLVKKAAVQDFGGNIVVSANTPQAREIEANRVLKETGGVFIHPSEDPKVIAGQGTVCLELVEQVKEMGVKLDAVIIPVGGGGLASGNAVALRALLGDTCKIILAEPAEMDDAKRSFQAGELVKNAPDNPLNSVADGLKTNLGPNTWPIIRDLVDDIVTVSEKEILSATKLIWERLKVAIEPSAGVGVAVSLSDEFNSKYPPEGGFKNVGVVLCGGNVDIIKIAGRMAAMGL